MPLPASTWASRAGEALPPARGATSTPLTEEEELIPATQTSSSIPTSTFYSSRTPLKSLSRLSDSLRASVPASQSQAKPRPRPLNPMLVPPFTQSTHVPTQSTQHALVPPFTQSTHATQTQTVTRNAFQFVLDDEASEAEATSADEEERVVVTVKQNTTAPEPTPTPHEPPARIECRPISSHAGGGDTGSPSLNRIFPGGGGIQPGGALELIGPSGIGKTQWVLQVALRARLSALCADDAQVLIIDTEGSVTSSMIRRIAAALCGNEESTNELLAGTHLINPNTPAELIATLRTLTSPYRSTTQAGIPHVHHLSIVVLDSTSYHVRGPVGDNERSTRRYIYSLLSTLHSSLLALNAGVRLVATTQMALKMFTPQGELVNYRVPGSVAWLVPQVGGEEGALGQMAVRVVLYRGVQGSEFGQRFGRVLSGDTQGTQGESTLQSSPVGPCIPLRFTHNGLIEEGMESDDHNAHSDPNG